MGRSRSTRTDRSTTSRHCSSCSVEPTRSRTRSPTASARPQRHRHDLGRCCPRRARTRSTSRRAAPPPRSGISRRRAARRRFAGPRPRRRRQPGADDQGRRRQGNDQRPAQAANVDLRNGLCGAFARRRHDVASDRCDATTSRPNKAETVWIYVYDCPGGLATTAITSCTKIGSNKVLVPKWSVTGPGPSTTSPSSSTTTSPQTASCESGC